MIKNRMDDYMPMLPSRDSRAQPVMRELGNLTQHQIASGVRQIQTRIQKNPAIAIGAACCAGVLLGWLVKRR